MPESERMTVQRLERNIASFEELVQTILESGEDGFDEAQQALVIRFLESKGYEVNTTQLRPRVLACAGILGVRRWTYRARLFSDCQKSIVMKLSLRGLPRTRGVLWPRLCCPLSLRLRVV